MLYDYNQTKNNFFDSLYTTNNQTIQIILNCMENTLINKINSIRRTTTRVSIDNIIDNASYVLISITPRKYIYINKAQRSLV